MGSLFVLKLKLILTEGLFINHVDKGGRGVTEMATLLI